MKKYGRLKRDGGKWRGGDFFTLSSRLRVSISVFWLLFSNCTQDFLLERTGADYFPLAQGNTWIYESRSSQMGWDESRGESTDTITLKVTGTATVAQREAWLIERDGYPTYWWKSDRRIDKFLCETDFFDGEEDTIFSAWIPWLHIPFVLGETKSYSFTQQTELPHDTILIQLHIDYKVDSLHGSDYKIKIKLVKNTFSNYGEFFDTTIYEEWYSQEIGMSHRYTEYHFNQATEKRTEALISYLLY